MFHTVPLAQDMLTLVLFQMTHLSAVRNKAVAAVHRHVGEGNVLDVGCRNGLFLAGGCRWAGVGGQGGAGTGSQVANQPVVVAQRSRAYL